MENKRGDDKISENSGGCTLISCNFSYDYKEKVRISTRIYKCSVLFILVMAILMVWAFLLFPLLFYFLEIKKVVNKRG